MGTVQLMAGVAQSLPSRTKALLPYTTFLTFSRQKFTSPCRAPPSGGEKEFVCTQTDCGPPT